MLTKPRLRLLALGLAVLLIAGACGSDDSDDSAATLDAPATDATSETADTTSDDSSSEDETASESDTTAAVGAVDVGLFFDGALAEDVTAEDCTLSGGTETTCYRITVAGDPVSYETGPFCPETITDSAEAGGIWFDGTGVYDLDGEFIAGLDELYGDDNWMMYDEDGNVLVTETAEEFDLAARPNVDPSLQNHCVEGRVEWLENGEPISTTVLIPVEPVLADAAATTRGNLGVTLDGVVIAQSAPVDAILSAYTIAAFDDCGGHYNPFDGYHLHGAVGCSELDPESEGDAAEGETPMFAYAMDGFPVHSALADAESVDLDDCNGHTTEELGYHYHANSAEQNQVLECLIGQTAADAGGGDAAGARPAGPPPSEEQG